MPKRVLVVDDEEAIVHILKKRLEQAGFEVETALDGEEGCRKAKEGGFDVMLLDLNLPKRDGESVCLELKMDPTTQDLQIIMLTNRTDSLTKEIGEKLGADAFIPKPFQYQDVIGMINDVLSSS